MTGNSEQNSSAEHVPVLADVLSEQISVPRDGIVIDATEGYGGHSFLFGSELGPEGILLGLDVDENCINRARKKLSSLDCKVILVRENFSRIAEAAKANGIEKADFILADLGICSGQLTDAGKGLSFQENMPLDMRLDSRLKTTAADIINSKNEEELADIIYKYGEERASRRIASFIVEYRRDQRITTTGQLAAAVCRALNQPVRGRRVQKTHPATKTFQALRIAVNDELGMLEKLLSSAPGLLKQNAMFGVISFHSLEDRVVKQNFKKNALNDIYELVTKKPIIPSREEIRQNPRARSSKLRIVKRK